MKKFFKEYWLWCLLLAIPGFLMPIKEHFGLSGQWFGFGIPPILRLKLGHKILFDHWLGIFFSIPFWFLICAGLVKLRIKSLSDMNWWNAFFQGAVSFIYLSLLYVFGILFTEFVWHLALFRSNWATIEKAYRFARIAAPIANFLWPAIILIIFYHDSLNLPAIKRVFHFIFMVCFCMIVSLLLLLLASRRIIQFDNMIDMAIEEQNKKDLLNPPSSGK